MEIKRITIKEFDERFYEFEGIYKPSVTYIQSVGLPTPTHLIKWIAEKGWEESQRLKEEAGGRGSIAHDCIDRLLRGDEIITVDLDLRVKRAVSAFIDWYKEEQPKILQHEYIVWGDKYAGTVDLKCRIKKDGYEKVWLIDYKTSRSIHDEHRSQIMAYKKADKEVDRVALLHLGNSTKKRYSFLPMKAKDEKYHWKSFQLALKRFQHLYPNAKPTIEEYPAVFSLKKPEEDLQVAIPV